MHFYKNLFIFPYLPPFFYGLLGCVAGIFFTTHSFLISLALTFIFLGFLFYYKWRLSDHKKSYFFIFFFIIGSLRTFYIINFPPLLLPLIHVTVKAKVNSIEFINKESWRYKTTLTIKNIFTLLSGWQKKTCSIEIYTKHHPHCKVADTIYCSLEKIPKPDTEFAWYLLKEDICATVFQEKLLIKVTHRPTISLTRWLDQKRKSLHKKIQKLMAPETFALFSSLYLGNKIVVKKDLETEQPFFKFWGISHILARSGLHLLLFILFWTQLLSLIPLHFFIKQFFLFFITSIYFLLSWPSVAFNRAFYTFLIYKTTILLNRTSHEFHILSITCLAILLKSPLQIFFLDFQLTFILTFCLLWISLTDHKRRILSPQNIAAKE